MKKLVLTLVIILPLILLVAIFAVTSVTALTTQIPASGLTIGNKGDNGIFSFDMATYTAPMTEADLGIEVEPYVASNRDYTLTVTDATTNQPSDAVSVNDEGEFILHDVGVSKLTYTSLDGGYTDSVLFNVTCSGVIDFTPQIMLENGSFVTLEEGEDTDYKATIQSGKYLLSQSLYPSNITFADVEYSTTGISVQTDASSSMSALFAGESVLSMTINNPIDSALEKTLTKTLKLTIEKCADLTINGLDATKNVNLSAPINQKAVSFYFELPQTLSTDDISITGKNISSCQFEQIEGNAYKAIVNLNYAYEEDTTIEYILSDGSKEYAFSINYTSYDFNIYSANTMDGKADVVLTAGADNATIKVVSTPSANIAYTFSIDNQNVASIISQNGNVCVLGGIANGNATLTVDWIAYDADGNASAQGSFTRNIVVANRYTSMLFGENASTYGLGLLAIANQTFEGQQIVANNYTFDFVLYNGTQKLSTLEDIEFISSNESILTFDYSNNKVVAQIHASGEVSVRASWKHGEQFGVQDTVLTFIAVDGVKVSTYEQLVKANNAQKEIVLAGDIYLGEDLFTHNSDGTRVAKYDSETMKAKLASFTSTLKTTADYTYYTNIGEEDEAYVSYCFEFNNNFYGNGYMLNAEYITNMLDSTGNLYSWAVFDGPLDFVAANGIASVKGQDNISFLVRKDDITIYNTTLKGCDDATLYENGTLNLTWLNNIGTTLELMADSTVQNCRVQNGRTALRAFGRYGVDPSSSVNVANEKITVVIDGCELKNAREFLLKIGTNRSYRGSAVTPSPYLYDQNGQAYTKYNSQECDDYLQDEYFVEKYVLNDVTLKDSTLSSSGLFTIGVESHFAGPMLAGELSNFSSAVAALLNGWDNLAATSYPAILRLVGNVVLNDWKNLNNIDSSTLIENSADSTISFLKLDVKEMLKAIQQYGGDEYQNIIYSKDGELYAHGGIAFYGGGKNYSLLDLSQYTFEQMKQYNVNISTLNNENLSSDLQQQGQMLPAAAGYHDFRFVMFDSTSTFKP